MTVVTPLSTTPRKGSVTSVSCTGSSRSTTIPTDASAWQIAMVATLPSQLAIHPQAWEADKKAASHDAVCDAEQHENAKAEPPRSIAFAALTEGKLGGGRVRLGRELRGQNGDHHRRQD